MVAAWVLCLVVATSCAVVDLPVIVPTPEADRFSRPLPWNVLENDGRDLTIGIRKGSDQCERLAGVEVIETPDDVEILAINGPPPPDSRVCPPVLEIRRFTVTLEEPLGDRTLTGCQSDPSVMIPPDCATIVSEP